MYIHGIFFLLTYHPPGLFSVAFDSELFKRLVVAAGDGGGGGGDGGGPSFPVLFFSSSLLITFIYIYMCVCVCILESHTKKRVEELEDAS